MAEFADRMKSFTDHLRSSITMRNEALAQVRSETEDLRDRAQSFMEQVANEHRNRAEELHTTLATHREECRQKAAELRNNQQESLRKTRADLQHMLSETRKSRQDTAEELRQTFQQARSELASDLSQAAAAWHAFTARQDEPVTSSAPVSAKRSERKPTKGGKHRTEAHHA
ncbi:MAG: hypothetical protein ACLQGP_23975 [Isosphaeraceae bacterium]